MTEPIKEDLQELIGESTLPIEMQLIISCLRAFTVTLAIAIRDAGNRGSGSSNDTEAYQKRYSKLFDDLLVE